MTDKEIFAKDINVPRKNELQLAEQLITGILKTLNLEAYDWRADQNENLALEIEINDRYHKALEEIEEELKEDIYCASQECGCDDFEECLKCTKEHILYIINKAKGKQ